MSQWQLRGYVYFILARGQGLVKIGSAKHYPDARLASLRIGSPVALDRLALRGGGREVELLLHRRFAHLRAHGEWFQFGPEIKTYIENECKPWIARKYLTDDEREAKRRDPDAFVSEEVLRCGRLIDELSPARP